MDSSSDGQVIGIGVWIHDTCVFEQETQPKVASPYPGVLMGNCKGLDSIVLDYRLVLI